MKRTNVIKYIDRLGLECDTLYDNKSYLFLFIELDDKNKTLLISMLKKLVNRGLPLLWYETTKGYHIISPALLHIQKWLRLVKSAQELYPNPFYLHDVIRISRKSKDGKIIYSENADTRNLFKVSDDLLKIFELKYNCKLPFPNRVKTPLTFTKYEDIELL